MQMLVLLGREARAQLAGVGTVDGERGEGGVQGPVSVGQALAGAVADEQGGGHGGERRMAHA